jgi:hypothetical protein
MMPHETPEASGAPAAGLSRGAILTASAAAVAA